MQWILETGAQHLICDLPSVDKESDGGGLVAHRTFWGLPPRGPASDELKGPYSQKTITELAYFDSERAPDGLYLVSLGVGPIAMDAAPSRPTIFRLKRA